jgi:predicted PurR-regulated permease PerM
VKAEDLLHELVGFGTRTEAGSEQAKVESGREAVTEAIDKLKAVGGPLLAIGSAFLLSLLFSFLIILDLPKLARGVRGLRDTKVRFIYEEVADNIHDFGLVLGRSLEAQLFIAILNTVLTAIGLYFMGLPNLVFLSMIVFFASFIPVAGVFISSTPICLVALSHGGLQLMLFAIALILVIHFIEAYILNPRIFGHHLRMNPVLVLIVLTVAGKLFGVWGLALALPVVNYFFGYAIRDRHVEHPGDPDVRDVAPLPAPARPPSRLTTSPP